VGGGGGGWGGGKMFSSELHDLQGLSSLPQGGLGPRTPWPASSNDFPVSSTIRLHVRCPTCIHSRLVPDVYAVPCCIKNLNRKP